MDSQARFFSQALQIFWPWREKLSTLSRAPWAANAHCGFPGVGSSGEVF
jgi:hypothetical protein